MRWVPGRSRWKLAVLAVVAMAAAGGIAFGAYAALNEGEVEAQAVRRRWVNVTIETAPQASADDIAVNRYEGLPEMYSPSPGTKVPGLGISKDVVVGDHIESSNVWVDATTGQVVHEDVRPEHRAEFDAVLATLRFEGPDPPDIWPYRDTAAPPARRQAGNITYIDPDPLSGVVVGRIVTDPGGVIVVYISNGRSSRHVDSETGRVLGDKMDPRDQEAFDRVTSSIEVLPE